MFPWSLILKAASFAEGVVISVVAVFVVDVLAGQPFPIAPSVRHAVMDHLPIWIGAIAALAIVLLVTWYQERKMHADRQHAQTANILHTATVGDGAVQIQSPTVVGDHNPITYNNDGVLNTMFTARNNPEEIMPTLRAMNSVLNGSDPNWVRTVSSDGRYTLTPRSPEAAERCPMRVETTVHLPNGESLRDILHRVAETLEPVTIDAAYVRGFRVFLGDTLLQDARRPGTLTFMASPLAPPINCVLRVPETSAELANLEFGLYIPAEGRGRLSNKQQPNAPIVVEIDFSLPEQMDIADEAMVESGPCTMTITTRPVPGRNVRHMVALYEVLRSLHTSRVIHIYDYAANELRFAAEGALPHALTPGEEQFADALTLIQRTFPTHNLPFGEPTRQEIETVFDVAHIIRTGELVKRLDDLTTAFEAWGVNGFLEHCDQDGIVRGLRHYNEGSGVRLFGADLDLGPSWLIFCPLKLVRSPEELRAEAARLEAEGSVVIDMVPADPNDRQTVRRYTRFMPEQEQAS